MASREPPPFEVRRLAEDDDRSGFRSGNADLDCFFEKYAGQNQFRFHIGTTYVAVDGEAIVGFATVTVSEVSAQSLAPTKRKRLPRYPLPVIRLARLAVDERAGGRGVGGTLMRFVFGLAKRMAADVDCVGVVVDAKPEAVSFYERLGFVAMEVVAGELGDRPQPTPMFIELEQIPGTVSR